MGHETEDLHSRRWFGSAARDRGPDRQEVAKRFRRTIERDLSFAVRLLARRLSDAAFWAEAVRKHNGRHGTRFAAPRTAEEFLQFGRNAGYVVELA